MSFSYLFLLFVSSCFSFFVLDFGSLLESTYSRLSDATALQAVEPSLVTRRIELADDKDSAEFETEQRRSA